MARLDLHLCCRDRVRRVRDLRRPGAGHLRDRVHLRPGRQDEYVEKRCDPRCGHGGGRDRSVLVGPPDATTPFRHEVTVHQALQDLWYGFGVALQPSHLMWSFFGVIVGNLIGVLPGMGALSAISMLLPLTFTMKPIPAIL